MFNYRCGNNKFVRWGKGYKPCSGCKDCKPENQRESLTLQIDLAEKATQEIIERYQDKIMEQARFYYQETSCSAFQASEFSVEAFVGDYLKANSFWYLVSEIEAKLRTRKGKKC